MVILKTIGLAKLLEKKDYKFQSPDCYPDNNIWKNKNVLDV